MYTIVLLSVLAVAAASPVNVVYSQGLNQPLLYTTNGNQVVSTLGQTQLVNNVPLTYTSGLQTIQNPIVYSSGVQTIQNPIVYSSGVQTIQNPVVLSSGLQTIQQSPVVLTKTAGVQKIETVQQQTPVVLTRTAGVQNIQTPVVLTRTAGVQNIQTIPAVQTINQGAKIETSYKPVEQHGYSISY